MKNKNDELLNGLIASGYDFRFGDYFNSGMDIFKKNMGSFIGFGALVGGIIIVLSIIPYVGSLAGSLLQTVFVAGIYIVANDIVRNQICRRVNPGPTGIGTSHSHRCVVAHHTGNLFGYFVFLHRIFHYIHELWILGRNGMEQENRH